MKILLSALIPLAVILNGCGTPTPPCSDEKTLALIRQIYREGLDKAVAAVGQDKKLADRLATAVPISISAIRAAAHDEKIGKYSCEATIEAKLPQDVLRIFEDPTVKVAISADPSTGAVSVSGGALKNNLHFTSQLTDDKKQHYVEMQGHAEIAYILATFGANGVFDAAKSGSATPAAAIAAPKQSTTLSIANFVGKHPQDALKEPAIRKVFVDLLGTEFNSFEESLSVSTDVELKGDYYIGSGCLPHSCTIEEAAYAIHKGSGSAFAARLKEGKMIQYFGVATAKELPAPLYGWYKERGGPN